MLLLRAQFQPGGKSNRLQLCNKKTQSTISQAQHETYMWTKIFTLWK